MTTLQDIFITTRIIAFKKQTFICLKQIKNETLDQFHEDLRELARSYCGDREDKWMYSKKGERSKTFEQKFKTNKGKILNDTPHTACVHR